MTAQHGSQAVDTLSALEALRGCGRVPETYVQFRIDLWRAQTAVCDALSLSGRCSTPSRLPVSAETVSFDPKLLAELWTAVQAALARAGSEGGDLVRAAVSAGTSGGLEALCTRAAFDRGGSDVSRCVASSGVAPFSLCWLGRALAAPFVAHAVAGVRERVARGGQPVRCPLCDSPPSLSALRRDDGGRVLFCGLCGQSWQSARCECPFCRSSRQWDKLATDEETPHWIEACGDCLHYLKTIDERRIAPAVELAPLAEAVVTLELEIVAEKRGYRTGSPYVAVG